jgi:molybdate transport system substrate-binding protein
LTLAVGCDAQNEKTTLKLYSGAGIRPPVDEIADAFGQRYGVTVERDFAGSEVLLIRIKLSRTGDIYMPGDVHYVEQAEQEGLVAGSETACYFIPVIMVQKGNPKNIKSLADLTKPNIKVGLGDPEACAIGRKTARIFAKNGISEEELAENVEFRALTVNDLGDKVKLGHLDAVIVWDAIAAYYPESSDVVSIPREKNVISTVPVAVLKSSENPELANRLREFITSEEGKAIFKKHHYSLALPE